MRHAVDARLHAARAAGFERLARRVEPDVAPLREEVRDVQIVVVDEGDAPAVDRVDRVAIDLLQMPFAGVVGRMRLSGEHDLHVPPRRRQQPDEAVGISEDQLGPLVRREAPREADRQRSRVEQRPRGDDGGGADVLLRPAIARALADKREEEPLQRCRATSRAPRRESPARGSRSSGSSCRSRQSAPELALEELRHFEREPRRHVHAVGDRRQRALSGPLALLQQRLPHRARHVAVQRG